MADLVLEFADGEFTFLLSTDGVIELQEKTKAGFGTLFRRIMTGAYKEADGKVGVFPLDADFHLTDLTETIRLGLIGGGMDPVEAKRRVDRYCYPKQPMKQTWELAAAIIYASMEGYEVKSPEMETTKKKVRGPRTKKGESTQEPSSPISLQ